VLALALAGGHHTLLFGSPGVGKTYCKHFLRALLPPESPDECYERRVRLNTSLLENSAFQQRIIDPHHSISLAGLLGGGVPVQAGAITAAHHNWLFLDELPEFSRSCLEAMRQPLETEQIVLARFHSAWSLPCAFTMVATANPCPCGWYGTRRCRCNPAAVQRYIAHLSGPVLDRIDIQWRVTDRGQIELDSEGQNLWRIRIARARERQRQRQQKLGWPAWARQYQWEHWRQASTTTESHSPWAADVSTPTLSRRRQLTVWRVARTLADLQDQNDITDEHWLEAKHLVGQSFVHVSSHVD
jgi:magnesium chelatase family protein